MKLFIICGLPASGKTTFSYTLTNDIFHLDNYLDENLDNLTHKLKYFLSEKPNFNKVIEGLITNNNEICNILNIIQNIISKHNIKIDELEIIQFKENREQCLINDKYRNFRNKNSEMTIKNKSFEYIILNELKYYKNIFNIKINYKDIYIMKDWEKFAEENNIKLEKMPSAIHINGVGEEKYIVGKDSWLINGRRRSCWGDHGDVEREKPKKFIELYELLDKICPNISIIKLKILEAKLEEYNIVFTREIDESDYYSTLTGEVNVCDFEFLYNILTDENII